MTVVNLGVNITFLDEIQLAHYLLLMPEDEGFHTTNNRIRKRICKRGRDQK